jgi:hypothetical protein
MTNSNNKTIYGIEDPYVRYFWAGYHLLILISSLVGDTVILVGSIKYNALKLSDFIVTTIQHIAVADLALVVFYVLPGFVSLVADRWILGAVFCYVRDPISYYCLPAGLLLICAMTTGKWIQLKWPLRTWTWTKKQAQMVCSGIWAFSLIASAIVFLVARNDIYFDYGIYNCAYLHYDSLKNWQGVVLILWLTIPSVVVIAMSTLVLKEARKARREGESLKWRGVSTVLLTAALFCVSTIPTVLLLLAKYIVGNGIPLSTEVKYRRSAGFLKQLNIMANIYIYTITVPSFRQFLRSRIGMVIRSFSRTCTSLETREPQVQNESE